MTISSTSQLNFNDTIKYTNEKQYEKDFAKYEEDYETFLNEKNKLKESINTLDDLDFDNIQYFKVSELKEIFPNEEDGNKASYLKRVSDFSNDDKLNKLLFNKAKELNSSEDVSNMLVILNYEKNFTKNREFDFPSDLNLRPYYNENDPLDSEFKFKDENEIIEFLDTINYHLNRGNEGEQSQFFANEFKELKKNYEMQMGENNALFTQMTKYTKPQTFEEAQKQKDEENIAKAMETIGLDSTSDFDRFAFGIMKEGYSKEEALERTNIYEYVGLVPKDSTIRKFGIEEIFNESSNYLTQNPTLKQSLIESFSKMDTEQLKKVGHSIGSEFGLALNDIFVEGENLSNEQFQVKVDEFWKKKFGSVQKIISMFDEKLQYFIKEHERGAEDYTYVINAFDTLIDTFLENSNKDMEDESSQVIKKENSNTKMEDLVKDILSLLRTGFTVSELEELEELLKKLQEKIKEGNHTEEEAEALLSNVEKAIAEMKKKLTGEAIIEVDEDNIKQEDSKTKKTEIGSFLERINKAITQLEIFKKASVYKEDPANESEILSMIKEFSKKS